MSERERAALESWCPVVSARGQFHQGVRIQTTARNGDVQ